jgi:hypothetical protein
VAARREAARETLAGQARQLAEATARSVAGGGAATVQGKPRATDSVLEAIHNAAPQGIVFQTLNLGESA